MVARNRTRKLVCTLVRVSEQPPADAVKFVRKPSAMVPWADPYIAGLVRRLQSEVRMERAMAQEQRPEAAMFDHGGASQWLHYSIHADLDPPGPADGDWEWSDRPRWTVDGQPEEL